MTTAKAFANRQESDRTRWAVLHKTRERLRSAALYRKVTGRPFVTVSYAQSLDGSIAAVSGLPLAISSAQSLELTHAMRAAHDAILVGIGCVLTDNPRLTVRLTSGRNPQPVVVDSDLRCPVSSNLLTGNGIRPWIVGTDKADTVRQSMLEQAGAKVIRVKSGNGRWVDLATLLETLAGLGVASLMVEGGAKIITSFLLEHLVNQVVVTVAPIFVGGLRAPDGSSGRTFGCLPRLVDTSFEKVGDDVVLRGDIVPDVSLCDWRHKA